jgi:hypothetical protein
MHLIDPTPVLCLEKTCPAVIGDALVYRNGGPPHADVRANACPVARATAAQAD